MDYKNSKQDSGKQSGVSKSQQGGKTNYSGSTEQRAVSSPVPGKSGGTKNN